MSRRKDYSVGAPAESQDGQRRRIDEWMTLVGQHKTTLGFDDWLQQVLDEQHQRAAAEAGHGVCQPTSRLLRQGDMLFRLEHGARYRVRHGQESPRVFTCVFDGETPYIAFENVVTGVRFPWITVDGVFRQTELRSMEQLDAGDAGKKRGNRRDWSHGTDVACLSVLHKEARIYSFAQGIDRVTVAC